MGARWSRSQMGKACCQWQESVLRHLVWLLVTLVVSLNGQKVCSGSSNDTADWFNNT